MNVLLLQMERAEDVEDLGGLVGAPLEAAEGKPVLPSDAGEGPSDAPCLLWPAKTLCWPLCRRSKAQRRWWRSRQSKALRSRSHPRRWLSSLIGGGEIVNFVYVLLNLGCCVGSGFWACARKRY
jgi:hypothetical protein